MTKKILVVDDEPDMVTMLKLRLEKDGYEVVTASTGEECLKAAKDENPDLVLLDILLPGMSGLEVSKRLKKDKITKNIPIIMVTALIGKDAEAKAMERGADYFISKPFDPEELSAKIKRVLS